MFLVARQILSLARPRSRLSWWLLALLLLGLLILGHGCHGADEDHEL